MFSNPSRDWTSRARCAGQPPNRFFPADDDTPDGYRNDEDLDALRREFCWTCPVRVQCLRDAYAEQRTAAACPDAAWTNGIRGGLTEQDRRQVLQLECWCGQPIDPKDMISKLRRQFCPDHQTLSFERRSKVET